MREGGTYEAKKRRQAQEGRLHQEPGARRAAESAEAGSAGGRAGGRGQRQIRRQN